MHFLKVSKYAQKYARILFSGLSLASSRDRASILCFSKDPVFSLVWIRVGDRCELGGKKASEKRDCSR